MHVEEEFVPEDWQVWAGWLFLLALAGVVAVTAPGPPPVVGSAAAGGLLLGAGLEVARHRTAVGRRLRRRRADRSAVANGAISAVIALGLIFVVPDAWLDPYASVLFPGALGAWAGTLLVQTVHLFEVA